MGVWTSAFQHQFLDGNPLNFDAAPGTTGTILPDGLLIKPAPPPDQRGFAVRPGHKFGYDFERPLSEVIGLDIHLRLTLPPAGAASQRSGRVVFTGTPVRFLFDFLDDLVRVQLFVGSEVVAAPVPVAAQQLSLRARWHTHGQAQILMDDEIRAYEPNLARGRALSIHGLEFGHHSSQLAATAPGFMINRILIKLLRRDDPARLFDAPSPVAAPPLSAACLRSMREADGLAFGIIRSFMGNAVSRLTRPWRVGMPGSPFTPEAVAAHEAGRSAGIAFIKFLAAGKAEHAEAVKNGLAELLTTLKASDPDGFKQAVAALKQAAGAYDPACLAELQPFADQHAEALQPILSLLEEVAEQIDAMGGANG